MDQETYRREIEVALAHLRDVARLRTLGLASALFPDQPRARRGWELSRYLLEAIDGLRPAPDDHDAWHRRRYDLLTLRFVNGLTPDETALRLGVSRRHFYRQLPRALDELAQFLWLEVVGRLGSDASPTDGNGSELPEESSPLELLRQEAAPLSQAPQSCSLAAVWQSVSALLTGLLEKRAVDLQVHFPNNLPDVALSPQILRQFLLGLLGDLLAQESICAIEVSAQYAATEATRQTSGVKRQASNVERQCEHAVFVCDSAPQGDVVATHEIGLSIAAQMAVPFGPGDAGNWQRAGERITAQLAALHGARLTIAQTSAQGICCQIALPMVSARAVLVVEDNAQVCQLFRRYLASGGYQALVATSGAEAITLARTHELYAVTLDLMMCEEDGWDVLQTLRHDPHTASLPIIVCTVLDHEELARMLGATAFLKKPVMREALLQTLASLGTATT